MKTYGWIALNGLILIGFGLWAYFGSATPSGTAFIPVGLGVLQLALLPAVTKDKKLAIRLMLILCVLIIGGLTKPLLGALDKNSTLALLRVSIMIIMSIGSFIFLYRKQRN